MRLLHAIVLSGLILGSATAASAGTPKERLIVLTDINWEHEPDDTQTLARLLAYADTVEIEALIASGGHNFNHLYPYDQTAFTPQIIEYIRRYGHDLPNLLRRNGQSDFLPLDEEQGQPQTLGYWPSVAYLKSRVRTGNISQKDDPSVVRKEIGVAGGFNDTNRDTAGSDLIVDLLLEDDPRPVTVAAWGGTVTLAQALLRLEKDHPARFDELAGKILINAVIDQDETGPWIRGRWPQIRYLWNRYFYTYNAHPKIANRQRAWGRFAEANYAHKGHLGWAWTRRGYWVNEGDTPSISGLLMPGLSDYVRHPDWGGWGGRYERQRADFWTQIDEENGGNAIARWHKSFADDLAARLDWARDGSGNRNPLIRVDGNPERRILTRRVPPGAVLRLDAAATADPDGDAISFRWWRYDAADNYKGKLEITDPGAPELALQIPRDAAGEDIHIILAVSDDGTPSLSTFRRIVIEVDDSETD